MSATAAGYAERPRFPVFGLRGGAVTFDVQRQDGGILQASYTIGLKDHAN